MTDVFLAADRFLQAEARLLERRLFDTLFRDAPADGVVSVLRGYQNADGGFGHGLEPDKRCPASLPIDVEVAVQALAAAGAADPALLGPACDFLSGVAMADGAVPLAFPVIEGYPRAAHWTDWTYAPGLNPTAGLAGLLHQLGFEHPWRDSATAYCWQVIESGELPEEVHALGETMTFLAHVPDRARAEKAAPRVLERMTSSSMFQPMPKPGEYGLTPLHVAATADSPWRGLFDDAQIDAHLDHLLGAREPDGGWPITWDPPSAASRLEWRGMVTLQAVRTLRSYRKI
ncbi:hypothetical protein BJY16_006182 [Actinoplanes octamycinicus]|uniref:Prenyltransferase/squalene oxidase-like repeat protein n=1 Tax=Actinoplanes octamycinicus TaxID=135948 RepID=A0A7W7H2C6_9ACTN|nr:hypothetical protein [Actinoplanes octamycinicus]MBB4742723.1 hypothetical protein [Actinoplanes octamycinicus]GIE63024.1 hypothetical protein Aoc01nite_84260 [Actinoplanes octamycinicus]